MSPAFAQRDEMGEKTQPPSPPRRLRERLALFEEPGAESNSLDSFSPLTDDFHYEARETRSTLSALACCTSRKAPPRTDNIRIWETADLTWWDFQQRRWQALWIMRTIYYRIKGVQEKTENMPSGPESDALWEDCHRENAHQLRDFAEKAKGLMIKAGQQLSAMVGVLPDIITQELLSLTDDLPVSTIDEVYGTLQRDLRRAPYEIFAAFEAEPIASASIAQVHRARLRESGEIVAVKVQHEGVDRIFLEDIGTLKAVAGQVAFWSPDLDFRKFAEELAETLPHELDFKEETRALRRAGKALREAGSRVIVPKVYEGYCGQHCFVMEFIRAGPFMALQDTAFCERHKVDKYKVLETLLDAFGVMAFKDGLFHADPHAGNVRLKLDKTAPGGACPVLLDWGLCREITDEERLSLAKVFHSLANFDISGLFDVLGILGFSMRSELMTDEFRRDLLEKARAAMKDTVNRQTTRANVQHDIKEYQDRLKKAAIEGNQTKGSFSPIYFLDDWPRCIILFMRMLQILRGLCVAVDAEGMPILQIFVKHAREALMEGSQKQSLTSTLRVLGGESWGSSGKSPIAQPPSVSPSEEEIHAKFANSPKNSSLEARVRAKLQSLVKSKKAVGIQVAVVQGGSLICDLADGTLSSIDARPVTSSTRFPLMGATPGIAALAALRALLRLGVRQSTPTNGIRKNQTNGLSLSSSSSSFKRAQSLEMGSLLNLPVTQIWPEFGGGDSKITLADLLSHRAGLQDSFPTSFGPSVLDNVEAVVNHVESVKLKKPTSEPHYAYLLQAFAMAKLGDQLAGEEGLLHWLCAELGPLGLDVAAPAGSGREASICRDLPELARVSMNEVHESRARRKERKDAAEAGSVSCHKLLEAVAKDALTFDPLQANSGRGAMFRGGISLGATAKGLAALLSSEELAKDLTTLKALELAGTDPTALGWLLTGGACEFTVGGLQALHLQGAGARGLLGSRRGGYGVVCGFGPCVVHFPDLVPGGVTVAVLVNDVLRGREAVAETLKEVFGFYGFAPSWTSVPLRVWADATRMAMSPETEPLVRSVGGLDGLRQALGGREAAPTPKKTEGRCCGPLGARRGRKEPEPSTPTATVQEISSASVEPPKRKPLFSTLGRACFSMCSSESKKQLLQPGAK